MRSILLAIVLGMAAVSLRAAEPPAGEAEFFENKIRPLLVARCYECHSAESIQTKKFRGGLRVDSKAGLAEGGDTGQPAIVAGEPDKSLLIKAVRYGDSDLKMPPTSRMPDAEIALLEQWIKTGAYDPRDEAGGAPKPRPIDFVEGRKHWAFQPIADSRLPLRESVPSIRGVKDDYTDLDLFVWKELDTAGLAPPALADKRTLLRRVTFDLTGLPPTPEETAAFLADESPEAFARVVDRLLASPRYGERWGRHWLDVARYADSNGLDENICHGNAWRYRDYVIASFNNDKPYDQFLTEQIAGDLLDSPSLSRAARADLLIATGFLSLGPKVLAEVDERKMEMDIIDEQVDTLCRSMLGLTVGCARCHDHKFDPIPTRDYYALAGIFKSTRTMEHFTKIAKWWENQIPTISEAAATADSDDQIKVAKVSIQTRLDKANVDLLVRLGGVNSKLPEKPETQYTAIEKEDLFQLRHELTVLEVTAPEGSMAMGVTEGKPADLPVHIRGSHLTLGEVVPRGFPQVLITANDRRVRLPPNRGSSSVETPPWGNDGSAGASPSQLKDPKQSGRLELARWIASPSHPLTARVIVNRVWRWHFGRGLVATTDNFGKLGEKPTHPQLLDWLASRFIADGWSLKQLHRRILLSSTYQASSEYRADAVRLDPENRLWSRFPVRRLEAEPIRDALLSVSGGLDLTMGGPSILHVKNREFLFDHTSKDGTSYDRPRRSVYLPVVRNHLYDFFELYDFPDSAVAQGDRPTTTVAPQALLALNSPLVWEAAGRLAEECIDQYPKQAVQALYAKVFAREPTAKEIARCQALLLNAGGDEAKRKLAWQTFCQSLLVSNEFVYVR